MTKVQFTTLAVLAANIGFGFVVFLWVVFLFIWPMAFDAPGSETKPENLLLILTCFIYGPTYFISLVLSWDALRKKRLEEAILVSLFLPATPVTIAYGIEIYAKNPTVLIAGLIVAIGFIVGYGSRMPKIRPKRKNKK